MAWTTVGWPAGGWSVRFVHTICRPLNLTSNQRLQVDGTLLASTDKRDYPLVRPLLGYGWGNDENCFPPGAAPHKIVVGSLRYAPVVGAYYAANVSVVGTGVIDGQGEVWWANCTACHYPPHNDSSFCEIASRPKLLEFQFVDGLQVNWCFFYFVVSACRTAPF